MLPCKLCWKCFENEASCKMENENWFPFESDFLIWKLVPLCGHKGKLAGDSPPLPANSQDWSRRESRTQQNASASNWHQMFQHLQMSLVMSVSWIALSWALCQFRLPFQTGLNHIWSQSHSFFWAQSVFVLAHSFFFWLNVWQVKFWSLHLFCLKTCSKMSQNKICKNETIAQQLHLVQLDI